MRLLQHSARLRARRWDVVVLGSGVAALIAAARLSLAGRRTLVVEEGAARDSFPGLREPFLLSGAQGGVLDACLRELRIPLIDRRRIVPQRLAYQLIGDDLRLEAGEPDRAAGEYVAWGLAKPEQARALVAWLEAPQADRQPALPPTEIVDALSGDATSPLARAIDQQARALSNLAREPIAIEAKRRLLAAACGRAAAFEDRPPWLCGILRRRLESLGCEFRSIREKFELVEVDGNAGIWIESRSELWLGGGLVLAAPDPVLVRALADGSAPAFLEADAPLARRQAFLFRAARGTLPEGMGRRLILACKGSQAPISVALFDDPDVPRQRVLVARRVVEQGDDLSALRETIRARLAALMPFTGDALEPMTTTLPSWDDDDWLSGPASGITPARLVTRICDRPQVYRLERSAVAALGFIGDLELGWRGGDRLLSELA
jgi:hypothetical protein